MVKAVGPLLLSKVCSTLLLPVVSLCDQKVLLNLNVILLNKAFSSPPPSISNKNHEVYLKLGPHLFLVMLHIISLFASPNAWLA